MEVPAIPLSPAEIRRRARENETPSQRIKREKAAERQRRKRERDRAGLFPSQTQANNNNNNMHDNTDMAGQSQDQYGMLTPRGRSSQRPRARRSERATTETPRPHVCHHPPPFLSCSPMLKTHLLRTLNMTNDELTSFEPIIAEAWERWNIARQGGFPPTLETTMEGLFQQGGGEDFRARFHRPLVAPTPFQQQEIDPSLKPSE
ncbi:hypothetical protein BDZ89DRAFT_1058705 [Hymenopellis radicata]|nr:hypothetical protein BDZ89DRAFT_1058705 [Hymenopellis radicata]